MADCVLSDSIDSEDIVAKVKKILEDGCSRGSTSLAKKESECTVQFPLPVLAQ